MESFWSLVKDTVDTNTKLSQLQSKDKTDSVKTHG